MELTRAASVPLLTLALLAIASSRSPIASAGEIWDGGGANSNWTAGPNWNTTGFFQLPPVNNGTANIHFVGNDNTVPNVDIPYSIRSLTFDAGSVSFFVVGQELTIGGGGVTNNDNSGQVVVAPVKLAANQTWTAAAGPLTMDVVNLNGFDLTMGGAFTSTLGDAISGSGDLILPTGYTSTATMSGSASNTYTGTTLVDAGTLVLSKTSGAVAAPGRVRIGSGGTVRLMANEQIAHGLLDTVELNGTLDLNGFSETISHLFIDPGASLMIGSGKLIITRQIANSFSGSVTTITGNIDLNAGIPDIISAGRLVFDGAISNGGLNIVGDNVEFKGAAANTYTGPTVANFGPNRALFLNKSAVDGAIRGDLRVTGLLELLADEQILAAPGNELFLGGRFTMNGHSETVQDLTLNSANVLGGGGTLTVLGTVKTLPSGFITTISANINLQGSRVFDIASGGNLNVDGVMSNGAVVKTGPGVLDLGPNTYAGGTFLNEGVVTVNADSDLGNPAGGLHFDGGVLRVSAGVVFDSTSRTIAWGPNGGTFDIVSNSFNLGTQSLTGSGPFTKVGDGKLVLAAPQSYTGGTTVAAGTLEGNTQSLQGNILNNANLTFNQTSNGVYAGNLTGTGLLAKQGAGILDLSGNNNNHSGVTSINAGILRLVGGNAIGDLSAVTLGNAAGVLLDVAGDNESIGSLAGGGANGGNVELGSGTLTTGGNNTSTTYAGVISGAGAVAKAGGGVFTLTGVNTYLGGTTLAGGVLSAGSDAHLGDAAGPLRFDGGTLRVTGALATTPRAVELLSGGGGLDIANAGNLFTYSGNITGPGSLTKHGPGKLVLTGSNSYAGGTTAMAGTLEGDAESLQGNILNNALVVFNQASDGVYAGNLSGVGEALKLGAGAVTLTGTSTGSGAIRVDEGDLRIPTGGQIANTSVLYVGDAGGGGLHVAGGGQVASGAGVIGNQVGATGEVIIDGAGSKWTIASVVQVGNSGAATVDVINGGAIQAPSINVGPLGIVGGDGHLVGDLQNGGLVSPGASPGALHLDGNYTQIPTGELLIELASASSYDQLLITQDATLAGTLTVNLIDGFMPISGQSFTLLTTDDVDFTFETETLPSVPGLIFEVIYNPQSVVLTVLPAFTADFDDDGDVDSDDLNQWQGDFSANALSDADDDGDSDGADFLAWQRQLGSAQAVSSARLSSPQASTTASAVVPEPTAPIMALAMAASLALRRRRPLTHGGLIPGRSAARDLPTRTAGADR